VYLLQRGGGVKGHSYMMVVKLIHDGLEWQESKDETAKAQRYVSEKRLVCVMSQIMSIPPYVSVSFR